MDPKRLFDFLAASPSCYHAVQALSDRLTQEGYTQLHEADAWTLTAGGKYFVTRNGSSLLAFRVPTGAPASPPVEGAYRLAHLQDQAQPGKEGRALCSAVDGKIWRHAYGYLV